MNIHWIINLMIKWISEYFNYSPNDYPNIKFNWLNEYKMNEYSMGTTSRHGRYGVIFLGVGVLAYVLKNWCDTNQK